MIRNPADRAAELPEPPELQGEAKARALIAEAKLEALLKRLILERPREPATHFK